MFVLEVKEWECLAVDAVGHNASVGWVAVGSRVEGMMLERD